MKTKTLTAILHKEEDMYVAECPEVGTVDQGETIQEALANLKEATRLYLEECPLLDIDPDEMGCSTLMRINYHA
ncbi:type II toxin-antitoxin system HicB family antitoxin [Nostoc edaphicum CCNP1411]|uniref:Type II toxin-antitoxin system HicB family antitoxin n=1 Tax=Nostoc edaphicum CCNP1411 TaxID=1472755 RepID=A0A7D7LAE7_9NOSO|nr:type II toxin-antitoxin system HicB family antitoxin [Nostoc edaphicum]QMS88413.1 type II toxin-antitoxin system HicB family antitoxin [Nostoc edaphicum CCNP1411]